MERSNSYWLSATSTSICSFSAGCIYKEMKTRWGKHKALGRFIYTCKIHLKLFLYLLPRFETMEILWSWSMFKLGASNRVYRSKYRSCFMRRANSLGNLSPYDSLTRICCKPKNIKHGLLVIEQERGMIWEKKRVPWIRIASIIGLRNYT